jgi:hypothetical protein
MTNAPGFRFKNMVRTFVHAVWCGVVWAGVVRCGAMRCGAVGFGLTVKQCACLDIAFMSGIRRSSLRVCQSFVRCDPHSL